MNYVVFGKGEELKPCLTKFNEIPSIVFTFDKPVVVYIRNGKFNGYDLQHRVGSDYEKVLKHYKQRDDNDIDFLKNYSFLLSAKPIYISPMLMETE